VTLLLATGLCAVDVVTVALPDPTTILTSLVFAIDHVVAAYSTLRPCFAPR
jgi:hypothetical protein